MLNLTTIAVLIATNVASAGGSMLLKHATATSQPALAILGATMWAGSAAGFAWLARETDLSVLSILTSALSLIAVQIFAIGLGEAVTDRKLIALGLLLAAIALVSLPGKP